MRSRTSALALLCLIATAAQAEHLTASPILAVSIWCRAPAHAVSLMQGEEVGDDQCYRAPEPVPCLYMGVHSRFEAANGRDYEVVQCHVLMPGGPTVWTAVRVPGRGI